MNKNEIVSLVEMNPGVEVFIPIRNVLYNITDIIIGDD